jgi:hypothetical protein
MAVYGAPRRFNSVSFFLLVCALAAGYCLWRFFPVYWDAWTIDHILSETANAVYKLNRLQEPDRSKMLTELIERARNDVVKRGNVDDPELLVNLNFTDENNAVVSADYHVVVTHPGIHKTTTLHFFRSEKANIKRVEW